MNAVYIFIYLFRGEGESSLRQVLKKNFDALTYSVVDADSN